jgi:hypothetical protein
MLRAILRFIFGGDSKHPDVPTERSVNDEVRAMANAILELRTTVKTADAGQITAAIDAFKTQADGRLDSRELAGEVAAADSMLTALSYTERLQRGEPLPVVATMSDGGPCYYRGNNVALERSREDDYGQLDISDKGIFYEGDKRLTIPWSKILTLSLSDRTFIVHRTSGGEPYSFEACNDGEARLAHLIALTLWKLQAKSADTKTSREGVLNRTILKPDRT